MIKTNILSQEEIKEINRVNIINIFRLKGETTKYEIAKTLGLSIPTITLRVKQFIEEGLVKEVGVAESTGGRKPVVLGFVKESRYSFGVDIRPDSVHIIMINLMAEVKDEIEFSYNRSASLTYILERISHEIHIIIKKNYVDNKMITGVGLSLPGYVDEKQLLLVHAPNIDVHHFSLREFEQQVGFEVSIENEANVAAFAESVIGKAKNKKDLVYISITEGVGTGIIIQDRIYKGTQKRAGEFGHMRVSNEDLKCNCGRTGCWELYASKKALLRYYYEETGKHVDSLSTIFEALKNQEANVEKVIIKYIENIFIGIENIMLGLNPEYIIIGGELALYEGYITEFIEKTQSLKNIYIRNENNKVLFSALGDKGSLLGAALLPFEKIYNYKS